MKKISILLIASIMFACSPNSIKNERSKKFKFYTQYNQFYLSSIGKNFNARKDFDSFKNDMNKRLSNEDNALIVFTQSYGNIKGDLIVLDKPNTDMDFSKYDHVVEGGLKITSGELQILNSPNSLTEATIKVEPGNYRVRVYSSNFASVKEVDLAHDKDNDYYHIEIWPSENMETKVLKQYKEN